MKKRFLPFAIFFCASTVCAFAQASKIDVEKLLAAVDNSTKAAPVKVSAKDARFFRKRISLINNDNFQFGLVPNTAATKTAIDKPLTAATTTTTNTTADNASAGTVVKISAKDAKFFRKHISLFGSDNNFQLRLVANLPVATIKKPQFKKIKIDDRDAADFRQHIRLFAGDSFQLALVPNFDEYGANDNTVSVLVPPVTFSAPAQAAINRNLAVGVLSTTVADPEANSFIKSTTNKELQDYLYAKIVPNMVDLDAQFVSVLNDTLRASIPQKMPANITTLKQQVPLVYNDTLRAALYQEIADHYLAFDSISIRSTRNYFMEQALEFTMKGLHTYSKMGDQNGLRLSYTNLARVYKAQKKYSEAKWFILQANTIARQQKDSPHIVSTLVELASIKMYIKDYKLAQTDLDEALLLSSQNHNARQESLVQANFAVLYGNMNDADKSAKAMKRHDAIEDSIRKAEEAGRMAELKKRDSIELAKKKLLTSAEKKSTKPNSTKKAASL